MRRPAARERTAPFGAASSALYSPPPSNLTPPQLTSYDETSLGYSWDRGNVHFVMTHYFPAFESAVSGVGAALEWLEADLAAATAAGKKTALFVHSVQDISDYVENVRAIARAQRCSGSRSGSALLALGRIAAPPPSYPPLPPLPPLPTSPPPYPPPQLIARAGNVVVVFAGHLHRCLGATCQMPYPGWGDDKCSLAFDDWMKSKGGSGKQWYFDENGSRRCKYGTALCPCAPADPPPPPPPRAERWRLA
jgi:hypothetical protein